MKLNIITRLTVFVFCLNFCRIIWANKTGPCIDFYEYACKNYNSVNLEQELEEEFNRKIFKLLLSPDQLDVTYKLFLEQNAPLSNLMSYLKSCRNEKNNLMKYLYEIGTQNMTNDIKIWSLFGEMQSYGWSGIISNKYVSGIYTELSVNDTLFLPARNELNELLKVQGVEDIETKIQDLYDFQKQWKEQGDIYLNSSTRSKAKLIRFENLSDYLQAYVKHIVDVRLTNTSLFNLINPTYFDFLEKKIKESSLDELKRMKLYLNTNFLYYLKPMTLQLFTDQECVFDFVAKFQDVTNLIYILAYFSDIGEDVKNCDILFEKIKNIAIYFVQENELNLSAAQTRYLINEFKNVYLKFGEYLKTNYRIDIFYEELPLFSDTNYYKNQLLLLKYQIYFLKHVGPNTDFEISNVTMPFYNYQKKVITLTLKSLQSALFESQQTLLQKISLMGFLLARELTNVLYNKNLNRAHNEISESILKHSNITNFVKCMEQLESSDIFYDHITDHFAVNVAYRTFKENYFIKYKKGKRRFFKNIAKLFCGEKDADNNKIRLLEIVKNFEPFAEAFGCPEGSFMNPVNKCKLF